MMWVAMAAFVVVSLAPSLPLDASVAAIHPQSWPQAAIARAAADEPVCSTPPTGIAATDNPMCAGASTTLTVQGGSLGTGASWVWYFGSGSCGGTFVGRGESIVVSPLAATQHFVRAEGDCNTTGCVSIVVEVTAPARWYRDADGDGAGDTLTFIDACDPPAGYVATDGDCDDANPAVHPGAAEICADGIDNDCSDGDSPASECDGDDETSSTGACCVGENCSVLTRAACAAQGGSYLADNADCTNVDCSTPNTDADADANADGADVDADDDRDGVRNAEDQCANTPPGASVDSVGCACSQLDADTDGVPDCDDLCPEAPGTGWTGCPPLAPGICGATACALVSLTIWGACVTRRHSSRRSP